MRRQTRKWFLIGAAVGGLAVFGAPVSTQLCGYNPETGTFERDCTTGEIAPAALAGAAVWGGIGAFIGHRRKTEDWTDAPLQDWQPAPSALSWRVSPTLSHEARGAGLRLQLSW